jgi:hypothetical protein
MLIVVQACLEDKGSQRYPWKMMEHKSDFKIRFHALVAIRIHMKSKCKKISYFKTSLQQLSMTPHDGIIVELSKHHHGCSSAVMKGKDA